MSIRRAGGGRKQHHPVWKLNFFKYDAQNDHSKCMCKIKRKSVINGKEEIQETECGKPMKGKNPSNLESHLESFHKKEYDIVMTLKNDSNESKLNKNQPAPQKSTQLSMGAYLMDKKHQFYAESSAKYEEKLDAVVRLFALSCLPTYLLDTAAFKNFIATMDPQFKAPRRTKIESRMAVLQNKIKENIQPAIASASIITLATDLWTKQGLTESFIAVSCAYYNKSKNKAEHAMLHLSMLPHPHTGEAIGAVLDQVMHEWKIPATKVGLIVTDNGANMIKAVRCMKGSSVTVNDNQNDTNEEGDK